MTLAVLGCSGLFLGRLFYLQIVEAEKYESLASSNQLTQKYVYPKRGVILDYNGVSLATNVPASKLYIDIASLYVDGEFSTEKVREYIEIIEGSIGINEHKLTDAYIRGILDENGEYGYFMTVEVASDLSGDQVRSVKSVVDDLEGLSLQDEDKRFYIYPQEFAHILGYTSLITADDLEQRDYLGYSELVALDSYRDQVGRGGIEQTYDKELSGNKGVLSWTSDAFGQDVQAVSYTHLTLPTIA